MANGHGGYRRPSSPAAVSGPGVHSQRTDGKPNVADLSNAKYGENQAYRDIQNAAPMGGSPASPTTPVPQAAPAAVQMPTPLSAPTQNPDQPVTAGAAYGPGPGTEALGLPSQTTEAQDLRNRYGALLPFLIRKADDPRSSQTLRDQVRYLISVIG